ELRPTTVGMRSGLTGSRFNFNATRTCYDPYQSYFRHRCTWPGATDDRPGHRPDTRQPDRPDAADFATGPGLLTATITAVCRRTQQRHRHSQIGSAGDAIGSGQECTDADR